MSQEALIESIQQGRLGLQDEICAENQYWFYLHETEELKSHLGIVLPRRPKKLDDEDTLTQTQTETQTQTVTEPIYYQSARRAESESGAGMVPEYGQESGADSEITVVKKFDLETESRFGASSAGTVGAPRTTQGVTEIQVRGAAHRETGPLLWKLVSALLGIIVLGLAAYLLIWMKN